MNIKKHNGITIVMLVITIIIMLILATLSVKYGSEAIERAKLEDIRTNMIMIKGKAKIIKEKHDFDENQQLVGGEGDKYDFIEGGKIAYQWTQADLDSQGLNTIKTTNEEFYVVCYEDTNNEVEVYYSLGVEYNGKICYSLTELNTEE